MPEAERQNPSAGPDDRKFRKRAARWGGALVVTACAGFIGHRLAALDPGQLAAQASWPLAGAMVAAPCLFALSDKLLSNAWSVLAAATEKLGSRQVDALYGRGVLAKYLPGSVFQYASRQVEGAAAGLPHGTLAKASVTEIALHLPASMIAAGISVVIAGLPSLGGAALAGAAFLALRAKATLVRAGSLQLCAFACFAASAALVGAALLPAGAPLGLFAALFLMAWLAGFLVPVAPGGLGVREAALLALAGSQFAPGPLLACVLALRIASILGDVLFGAIALLRARRT
ncbi:MAG: hypothetical protein V4521_08695 [Pseudomonadota bacterium]